VSLRPETFDADADAFAVELKERIVRARDESARLEELRHLDDAGARAELAALENAKFAQAARRARRFAKENLKEDQASAPSKMSIWTVCSPGDLNEAAGFAIHLGIALDRRSRKSAILDLAADRLAERWADLGTRQDPVIVHGASENLNDMLTAARNSGVANCVLIVPSDFGRSLVAACWRSDLIVVPVSSAPLHLLNLNEWLSFFHTIGSSRGFEVAACRAVVVGARLNGHAGGMLEVIEAALHQSVHVCRNFVDDRVDYDSALRKYQGITEYDRGDAAHRFKSIVRELETHERRLRGYV
jgi:hypothetical protein